MKKVLLAFFFLVVAVIANAMVNKDSKSVFSIFVKPQTVTIDDAKFSVTIAKTQAEREKGLSGKDQLPQDEGMLFLFDKPDYYEFWMKDMKFPLDMIFINDNKVVDIFPEVSDKNQTIKEKSRQPADKVLEINSGITKKYGFKIGDSVKTSL
jgi:hypothetical protein